MNQFKAVQDTELTQAQKEKYWKENVSGSRLKKLIHSNQEAMEEYKIAIGAVEQQDNFSDRSKEKMKFGNYLENTIVEIFKQESGLGDRVFTDKRTFIATNPLYQGHITANFDAAIITDEGYKLWKEGKITDLDRVNYIDTILEVKNTEMDIDNILMWYKSQTWFYSWFFNAKNSPKLVYLQNGNHLGVHTVEYNRDKFIDEILKPYVIPWIQCVINKTWKDNENFKVSIAPVEQFNPTDKQKNEMNELYKIKTDLKNLKAKETAIANSLKNTWNSDKEVQVIDDDYRLVIRQTSRTTKDWNAGMDNFEMDKMRLVKEVMSKYGIDISTQLNNLTITPSNKTTYSRTLVINTTEREK